MFNPLNHLIAISFGIFILSSTASVPVVATTLPAQAMCMKTGERISGMNKLCYYNCLGSGHVVTQSSVSLCALSVPAPSQSARSTPERANALTCYARGERISGMNKICYYDCLGSAHTVTQSSVSLCPLSVQR